MILPKNPVAIKLKNIPPPAHPPGTNQKPNTAPTPPAPVPGLLPSTNRKSKNPPLNPGRHPPGNLQAPNQLKRKKVNLPILINLPGIPHPIHLHLPIRGRAILPRPTKKNPLLPIHLHILPQKEKALIHPTAARFPGGRIFI